MKGNPAMYLGRVVDKAHFRVFIYDAEGKQKLIESWDDFESHMQSGIWFAERQKKKKPRSAAPVVLEVTE